ncbi:unnamed protein product [Urochloa humidicola]
MPLLLTSSSLPALPRPLAASSRARVRVAASAAASSPDGAGAAASGFPSFLPRAVERIRDGAAIRLAKRIERVPVQTGFWGSPILSSCVRPLKQQQDADPIVLLHGFDSSCLEWRYTYPLLEEAGHEAWAVDILGWGFSDLATRPSCDVASKREHLYQFWKAYIKRPMVLVGPSLGAAVAIDFSTKYPEAVSKLIFIGASVYSEGPKEMTRMPKFVSYAGVFILKSLPLRFLATSLAFNKTPNEFFDWVQVKHKCLIMWGEDDGIISSKLAYRLHHELPDATLRLVRQCGHIPHVEKPREAAKLVLEFLERDAEKVERASSVTSVLTNS